MTIAYKCTRANGKDFKTDSVEYAVGVTLEHPDPELSSAPCGRGYHVSPTAQMTCQYGERSIVEASSSGLARSNKYAPRW